MKEQQVLQIICLQTQLTQYHYQSYSILKHYFLKRIHLGIKPKSSINNILFNEQRAQQPTLVIFPECTGTWLYLMCVPMPQFLPCETNCTIIAGSIFIFEKNLYNISCVFEPNNGSIYSIPNTNVDIGVLICADSWMPQIYEQYNQIQFNSNRRFLFIIVALNIGQWNIPWSGYDIHVDTPNDIKSKHSNTYSLSKAWFQYAINRGFDILTKRNDLIGYGVICCQGILNIMNDIQAEGESIILIKRSINEAKILFEAKTYQNERILTSGEMNKEILIDIGSQLARLRMYPLFDMCHYLLTALHVREDIQQYQTVTQNFTRRHPLSCWLSTMLLCFSGSILANFLLGESPIKDFIQYQHLLLATVCWYFVFYSPIDIIFRLLRFLPFRLIIGIGKEIQRTKKIYEGVYSTLILYPDSYIIVVLIGTIKGCGGTIMSSIDRFIRGVWLPNQHEFLFPSFTTKGSFLSSLIFLLSHIELLKFQRELIYLCIISMFIYVRIITLFFKQYDPLMPFENLSSGILFNSWIETISDAYRRATTTNNLTTQYTPALPGVVSSLTTTTTLMNDGQMKGIDGKKRD